jgi:hypothetical protein
MGSPAGWCSYVSDPSGGGCGGCFPSVRMTSDPYQLSAEDIPVMWVTEWRGIRGMRGMFPVSPNGTSHLYQGKVSPASPASPGGGQASRTWVRPSSAAARLIGCGWRRRPERASCHLLAAASEAGQKRSGAEQRLGRPDLRPPRRLGGQVDSRPAASRRTHCRDLHRRVAYLGMVLPGRPRSKRRSSGPFPHAARALHAFDLTCYAIGVALAVTFEICAVAIARRGCNASGDRWFSLMFLRA